MTNKTDRDIIMAEKVEDEKKSNGSGGNRNAIAYGLLQGAGVNTNGLTPSQAWEMVSQLNLMESREWKRTDEDKRDIKAKNEQLKREGSDINSIKKKAEKWAKRIDFSGVGNKAALNEAVNTIDSIMNNYKLDKMEFERVKNLANGTMASANDSGVNIGARILRNPNAAYRICVTDYKNSVKSSIKTTEEAIALTKNAFEKERLKGHLDKLKAQADFSRHNVIYKGQEVESVITHEMGHVLAGQIFGFIKTGFTVNNQYGANKKIMDCYNESKRNGDIKKVSAYADTEPDEFFAECFTMYTMKKERLPENINKMMTEVLSKWKR